LTAELREYGCEGQRLLGESSYSAAEVARLIGRPKQRVSDWRRGRCRPEPDDRVALERAVAIPARSWDAAPLRKAPPAVAPAPDPVPIAAVPGLPDVEALDLPALGLVGLERLAARLRALEPSLPPRERVSALQAEARVLAVHEGLRQKAADARLEYLESPEFLAEVRALIAAVPGDATALRSHLARLGVELPPLPTHATVAEDPPTSLEDVDDLIRELETAESFRNAKEPGLALAHTLSLNLSAHANAIAALVLGDHVRVARLLSLLEGSDEQIIRTAIERAMTIRDVAKLPVETRRMVAELLARLGHEDITAEIGGNP
jgi:hypothetical protein